MTTHASDCELKHIGGSCTCALPSKDIVERLRSAELQWPVRHDAAEEIERLSALVEKWQRECTGKHGSQSQCVTDETPAEPVTSAWVDFTIKRVHELVNGEYAKGWRDCVAAYNKAGELIFSGEKIPPEWESELWPQVPLPPTANECREAVNALIDTGHLSGNGTDLTAQRNGIILAANAIAALMRNRGALKTDADRLAERLKDRHKPIDLDEVGQPLNDPAFTAIIAKMICSPEFKPWAPITRILKRQPRFRRMREVHAQRARKLRRRGEYVHFMRWDNGHCIYGWGGPIPETFTFNRMPRKKSEPVYAQINYRIENIARLPVSEDGI